MGYSFIADRYGRKLCIIIIASLQAVSIVKFQFINSFRTSKLLSYFQALTISTWLSYAINWIRCFFKSVTNTTMLTMVKGLASPISGILWHYPLYFWLIIFHFTASMDYKANIRKLRMPYHFSRSCLMRIPRCMMGSN